MGATGYLMGATGILPVPLSKHWRLCQWHPMERGIGSWGLGAVAPFSNTF